MIDNINSKGGALGGTQTGLRRCLSPVAGPLGTALAMLIGAAIMILIGVNYHYMMQRYPDAGGAFTYTKKELGYDHGFLSAWFLALSYLSVLWANVTALAGLSRYFLRGALQFGFHYTVAGYDVYFGEVLLALHDGERDVVVRAVRLLEHPGMIHRCPLLDMMANHDALPTEDVIGRTGDDGHVVPRPAQVVDHQRAKGPHAIDQYLHFKPPPAYAA